MLLFLLFLFLLLSLSPCDRRLTWMVFAESFFSRALFPLPINGISVFYANLWVFALGVRDLFLFTWKPTNQPPVIVPYRDSIKLVIEAITFHYHIFRH